MKNLLKKLYGRNINKIYILVILNTVNMKLPQEIEVMYVLPAIRKELVSDLLKLKMNQKQISEKLMITEAAVSQYTKNKRGNVELNRKIKKEIKDSALKIKNYKGCINSELIKLCNFIRKNKFLCKIHKDHDNVNCNCSCCVGGEHKCLTGN